MKAQPPEGSFYNPAPRKHLEALTSSLLFTISMRKQRIPRSGPPNRLISARRATVQEERFYAERRGR